jgi:hypothetical protein
VTIARDGSDYNWSFLEVAAPGRAEPAEPLREESVEPLSGPEDAFWSAWTAIEQHAS